MLTHLTADQIACLPERRHIHQFEPNGVRHMRTLGLTAGLNRLGVHLIRLTSGHVSTQQHWHDADEEFIYILSGRGVAWLDAARVPIRAGDFLGFGAPSAAHALENPFAEDLVYLVGGERNAVDLVHYPRIERTLVKAHGARRWIDWAAVKELP